jgi:hypothetical protein
MNKIVALHRRALAAILVTQGFCCLARSTNAGAFITQPRTAPSSIGAPVSFGTVRRVRPYRRYPDERDMDDTMEGRSVERIIERPTQTRPEAPRAALSPSKPKIVVLGASGRIGRLVIRQLLEMPHLDANIVAFVRDFDKASRVLYDDVLVACAKRNKRGPRLQIVVGDLVPSEDLPGYTEEESEKAWLARAESAAIFYGKNVVEFDNQVDDDVSSDDEALESAIQDCTTIINCVGSVRPTNVWTDFLARPLSRLLRSDVSGWCRDCRHPYYVHYQVTQKVLLLAETEQRRREALAISASIDSEGACTEQISTVPRIRLIRISDLCVVQSPWYLVPIVTNMLRSMVLRYQELAEKAMEASTVIDTVTLRPGDLVNDERDITTTTLQVASCGSVPCPARVGREDVAALAVAAALFDSTAEKYGKDSAVRRNNSSVVAAQKPFHYTFACRWASEEMDPYPPQGQMADGHAIAHDALQAALRAVRKQSGRRYRRRRRSPPTTSASGVSDTPQDSDIVAHTSKTRARSLKPYGIFVAVPVYVMMWWIVRSVHCSILSSLFPGMGTSRWGKHLLALGSSALSFLKRFLQDFASLLIHTLWIRRNCNAKYISF